MSPEQSTRSNRRRPGANRPIHQQPASIRYCRSGVGVFSGQDQRSRTHLGQATQAAHHPRKEGAQVVAAHGQVIGSEEDVAASFD